MRGSRRDQSARSDTAPRSCRQWGPVIDSGLALLAAEPGLVDCGLERSRSSLTLSITPRCMRRHRTACRRVRARCGPGRDLHRLRCRRRSERPARRPALARGSDRRARLCELESAGTGGGDPGSGRIRRRPERHGHGRRDPVDRAVRNDARCVGPSVVGADPGRRNERLDLLCSSRSTPAAVAPGCRSQGRQEIIYSCSGCRPTPMNAIWLVSATSRRVVSSSEDQRLPVNLHRHTLGERGRLSRWHLLHWSSRLVARLGNLRNVVRQELISRQLADHLPAPPARILDVGAGQGTKRFAWQDVIWSPRSNRMPRCVTCSPTSRQQPDAVRARLSLPRPS